MCRRCYCLSVNKICILYVCTYIHHLCSYDHHSYSVLQRCSKSLNPIKFYNYIMTIKDDFSVPGDRLFHPSYLSHLYIYYIALFSNILLTKYYQPKYNIFVAYKPKAVTTNWRPPFLHSNLYS